MNCQWVDGGGVFAFIAIDSEVQIKKLVLVQVIECLNKFLCSLVVRKCLSEWPFERS